MKTFLEEMKESFPKNIPMPPEIEAMFIWLEEKGFVHKYTSFDKRYANLYPEHLLDQGGAFSHFIPVERDTTKYYTGNDDPMVNDRLALFVNIDSTGDLAGLWQDEDGSLKYVYVGAHGEPGCILTDNAIDFLRLLAIGYDNVALSNYNKTATEDYLEYLEAGSQLPIEPIEFREWVEKTFAVKVPKYGKEIVKIHPSMVNETTPDPFLQWCRKVCN